MNTPLVYWPMIESSLGIVGACLPMLRPLFTRKSRPGGKKLAQPQGKTLVAREIASSESLMGIDPILGARSGQRKSSERSQDFHFHSEVGELAIRSSRHTYERSLGSPDACRVSTNAS